MQRRRLALLALLGCSPKGGWTRDKLIGLLWPEASEQRARHILADAIYVIRRELGEEAVVCSGDILNLNTEVVSFDVAEFEGAIHEGELEKAVGLYTGPFLDGFHPGNGLELEHWIESERTRLATLYSRSLETLAGRAEETGDFDALVRWWQIRVTHEPYNSHAALRFMQALEAAGNPAGALRHARVHESLLEELGAETPKEVLDCIEALRRHEVATSVSTQSGEGGESKTEEASERVSIPSVGSRPSGVNPGAGSEVPRPWLGMTIYAGGMLAAYATTALLARWLGLPNWVRWFALLLLASFVAGLPPILRYGSTSSRWGNQAFDNIRRAFAARTALVATVVGLCLLWLVIVGYSALSLAFIPTDRPEGRVNGVASGAIILADVENHTSDSTLAEAVSHCLRIDMSRSSRVQVVEPTAVARALRQMGKAPTAAIDERTAREVAIRHGHKAVVVVRVTEFGVGYVVTYRVLAPDSGTIRASGRVTAVTPDEIIEAVDQVSKELREWLGSSLDTIEDLAPLTDVTTSSLDALKNYTIGLRTFFVEGDYPTGLALLEQAASIDTAFAWNQLALGLALEILHEDPTRVLATFSRAYELRERSVEEHNTLIEAVYLMHVKGDIERAITIYRTHLKEHPHDAGALNNLGNAYHWLRDYERAQQLFESSVELDSSRPIPYLNLIPTLTVQGKIDEAKLAVQHSLQSWPDHPKARRAAAYFAAMQADYERAGEQLSWLQDRFKESALMRSVTNAELAALALLQGRLSSSEEHLREAMRADQQHGSLAQYVRHAIQLAWIQRGFRDSAEQADQIVEIALARYPLDSMPPLDRPYAQLSSYEAWGGDLAFARLHLSSFEQIRRHVGALHSVRRWPELYSSWEHALRGHIALAEGRPLEAVAHYHDWGEQIECTICALPYLAWAYDQAEETDSAIAYYERYVETPYLWRLWIDSRWLAVTFDRLADLHARRGNTADAIRYYRKLVDLWKHADPELQPQVLAARRAIEALQSDGGR